MSATAARLSMPPIRETGKRTPATASAMAHQRGLACARTNAAPNATKVSGNKIPGSAYRVSPTRWIGGGPRD